MHIDARQLRSGSSITTDLCIIGGGAAGITIARELAGSKLEVCLLEAGGFEQDVDTERLQELTVIGRRYEETTRVRCLGGNTHLWGGHCVPMRAINFQRLQWSSWSGWPFDLEVLLPYYRRAHHHLDLGPMDYDPEKAATALGLDLFPFDRARIETVMSRYRTVQFGTAFRGELVNAQNISLYTHANVTSIDCSESGEYVDSVSLKTLTGVAANVRARWYVLATGGIENARILLASNAVHPHGLGNENDLVGRFFMEHIWFPKGSIVARSDRAPLWAYGRETPTDAEIRVRFHLALPEKVVESEAIPDFRCELEIVPADPEGGRTEYRLFNHFEQAPNPDSRIALSQDRDSLGMQKATVDWRLSEIDRECFQRAQELLAAEVKRSGFGRLNVEFDAGEPEILAGAGGGHHHMGTTRMHDDPRQGVVDRDCRIHGLQNVFVAGSSIFPTGGHANPTLTIVALAIRLADHLRQDPL